MNNLLIVLQRDLQGWLKERQLKSVEENLMVDLAEAYQNTHTEHQCLKTRLKLDILVQKVMQIQ